MDEINWNDIKKAWISGEEILQEKAVLYGISIAEICLKAQQDKWGERGSYKEHNFESLYSEQEILTDIQVTLAHKTDLGRLRLIAAVILEGLRYIDNVDRQVKILERLSKIYSQVIPLERAVFGIDVSDGELPDGITINVGKG